MATSFNTRISLKYDTYEQWHTNNPVLLKGELAIVEVPQSTGVAQNEPTYLLKVGNGTDKFDDLKWISGTAADVYEWAKASTKPTYAATEITGLEDYISGKVQDTNTKYQIIKNGDMGFKLQYKELNGQWTDQNDITLVAPVYTLVEGTENGTVKFNDTDVKVHGLGGAAFTEPGAYDPAGSAAAAKEQAVSEAGTAADQKIAALNIDQYAKKTEVSETINAAKTELIGEGSGTSNTIKGVYDEAKGYTDTQIAAKLASTYKPAGSINFESLPALSATEEGKVYNIIDAFSTTEDFVEGAGKTYPEGTNIVCINSDSAGTYKWDVLAGMIDLSAYDTAETAQGKIDAAKQAAIDAAALDATQKANTAEQNAKSYADGLKSTIDESLALKADKSNVNTLTERVGTVEGELAKKANDSDISTVGKTGNITDLIANGTIILNCGTSSTVMDPAE